MKTKKSLRYQFLTPLLLGGLFVTLFGSGYIYQATRVQATRQLHSEGLAIASAFKHSVMVAHNNSEIQHVVEEIYRDSNHLALAMIISDDIVMASSENDWINQPLSEVKKNAFDGELLIKSDHREYQWNGVIYDYIELELGLHISDHTHEHSDVVTGYLGAKINNKALPASERQVDLTAEHDVVPGLDDSQNSPFEAPLLSVPPQGTIYLLLDQSSANQVAIYNTVLMIGGFSAAIIITMMLAFVLMSKQVLQPIEAIAKTMKQRRSGNKNVRAVVYGDDEISVVSETLNDMLDTLGENEQTLQRLTQAIEQSPISVVITDSKGFIEYVNPKFCSTTGYTSEELIGHTLSIIKSDKTPDETYKDMWITIQSGGQWRGEMLNQRKDGELFWENVTISPILDNDGNTSQYLGMKEDITIRKEYEKKLVRQANFDDLTGLPNRILAQDRLAQALTRSRREGKDTKVALLLLDLDDFKSINDTLGHQVGDELLIEVAARFKSVVRETDTVARFGGDEFIIVMTDVHSQSDVELMAEKLLQQLTTPFNLGGMTFFSNVSIGIALYPDDGADVLHLLQDADSAMNKAKQEGRGRFSFFTAVMNDEAIENLRLEQALRHALELNQLQVHYQPVIDFTNGDIVGAEALLRWEHPEFGMIPPTKFIPLAERTNMIQKIGAWVLKEACRTAAYWVEEKQGNFRIAVNLSSKQFGGDRLYNEVKEALDSSGLPAKNLELEFTESVLMHEDKETMSIIQSLHEMGIRFAIDDFGTGYSSISYLRQYPFNTLKIDRSFVNEIITNESDASLVSSIIAMAESLNLEVLAEGIEEQAQFDFLREAGAQRCQGWLFSKALPEREFTEKLRNWNTTEKLIEAVAV